MEDFYKNVIVFVEKMKAGGRKEVRTRAEEAQQRIMSSSTLDRTELVSELSVLFDYVGSMLYWRGYRDAEHRSRAINPVHRTPSDHKEFRQAVTKMIERNLEMEVEEISAELERRKVEGAFDIDGRREEFGPNGVAWTEKPIPRSIEMAIRRIRSDTRRKAQASQRQSVLALRKRKG